MPLHIDPTDAARNRALRRAFGEWAGVLRVSLLPTELRGI